MGHYGSVRTMMGHRGSMGHHQYMGHQGAIGHHGSMGHHGSAGHNAALGHRELMARDYSNECWSRQREAGRQLMIAITYRLM